MFVTTRQETPDDASTSRPRTAEPAIPIYTWMFVAGLCANMFAGNFGSVGLPIGIDRPLFLVAIVLMVLDGRLASGRLRAVHWVMAVAVLWTMISWLSSGSLVNTTKAFAFADRLVIPFLMFAVGPFMFATVRERTLLLKTLTVVGVYLGITAIGEISGIGWLVFPSYISNPDLGLQFGRARGPFLYSEAMGMTAVLCLSSAALLASRTAGIWRLVAGVSALLGFVTVILSLTRTVWLSAILVVVLATVVVPSLRRIAPVVLGGLTGAIVLVLAAFPTLQRDLEERLTTSRSVYDRLITNDAALRIVEAHPLLGIGWGEFFAQSSEWVRQPDLYPLTNVVIEVHNVFLARAAETGIPGAALWVAAMMLGPVAAVAARTKDIEVAGWRLLAGTAVIVWFVASMFSPNNYPLPNNLIWLIGGIAGRGMLVGTLRPSSGNGPAVRSAVSGSDGQRER